MKIASTIAMALLLASCAAPTPREALLPSAADERQLGLAMGFMPGTFESLPQANGPGVGTRMRVVEFWQEKRTPGEHWVYVEHTRIGQDDKPFRQRIYRFAVSKHKFWADIYAMPGDPKQFVGEWRKPKPFAAFTPEQLIEYKGCRMAMGHMIMIFWVRTEAKTCRTDNRDVAYEMNEIMGNSSGMKEGTMGYDQAGRQIAGEPGVWEFRRVSAEAR